MRHDPVRLLDTLTLPASWCERTDLDTDAAAARIHELIIADAGSVASLDARRRRRQVLAGATVVGALITGGAVAAIWNRSPEQAGRITCYSGAAVEPEVQLAIAWDGEADPTERCATAWANGAFGTATPDGELHACITPEGITAVIPGDGAVCNRLGLADFVPLPADDLAIAVAEAGRELTEIFVLGTDCVPLSESRDLTERVLEQYALTGWTVTVDGTFSAGEPCASVALDVESTTAYIRPVRRG